MHVAFLTKEFPPHVYGGAGVAVEYLSNALSDLVDLKVYCFGEPRKSSLVAAAFEPWSALDAGSRHDTALQAMAINLQMAGALGGADIVHSHTWYANLGGHLAKLLHGIPHVATAHSLEPLRPWKAEQLGGGYALSCFCERTAYEAADAVIAVSEAMRSDILASYPAISPERVVVIHNGVDTSEFAPDYGTDALGRLGIDPEQPLVVFFGRITRQKGIDHLLSAAEDIDSRAQLAFFPSAPDTPELGEEMRAQARALASSRGNVLWHERTLPRRELVQVLTRATLFVCPSIYEPFGLVNVEAMACGTAVVGSTAGGIPEIVVDGETGILVPFRPAATGAPADPGRFEADLAEAVNRLVKDPETARRMGEAGRRRAVETFSWSTIAARTVELYRSLVAQRS